MNAPVIFDTLAFVRKLEAGGIDARQAEAIAGAFGDAMQEMVATKSDVAQMGRDLRAELRELELRLKHDLTLRLGGIMAGAAALIVAILGVLISLR